MRSYRVAPDRWSGFWSELAHVVRNAVDHGLESAQEREQAGKTEPATLTLCAKEERGRLVIEVTHNGRGVDWNNDRGRAPARRLWGQNSG